MSACRPRSGQRSMERLAVYAATAPSTWEGPTSSPSPSLDTNQVWLTFVYTLACCWAVLCYDLFTQSPKNPIQSERCEFYSLFTLFASENFSSIKWRSHSWHLWQTSAEESVSVLGYINHRRTQWHRLGLLTLAGFFVFLGLFYFLFIVFCRVQWKIRKN